MMEAHIGWIGHSHNHTGYLEELTNRDYQIDIIMEPDEVTPSLKDNHYDLIILADVNDIFVYDFPATIKEIRGMKRYSETPITVSANPDDPAFAIYDKQPNINFYDLVNHLPLDLGNLVDQILS